jgi:hypothetical protein
MGHPFHYYFDFPYINDRFIVAACRALPGWTAEGGCPYIINYTRPWSSMALATFRKPPILAPFTRLPGVPYFSAVS